MPTHSFEPNEKEIGGYFGIELPQKTSEFKNVIALASARNCLEYVIKAYNIKEIYVPYYTCPVVWDTIKNTSCKLKFYNVDHNLLPKKLFDKESFILYTNYFGICGKNVKKLEKEYKNLIVDNAHAFYLKKCGIASFNSPRKFFGVSDGGILYCEKKLDEIFSKDTSFQRFSHLLKRIDMSATIGYDDFLFNENSLNNQPIRTMSNLTTALLSSLDLKSIKVKRITNFEFLHQHLSESNELKIERYKNDIPLVYPYLIKNKGLRKKLIKNKIYITQYWSPQKRNSFEEYLYQNLLPLPIDQRYDKNDLIKIIEILKEKEAL